MTSFISRRDVLAGAVGASAAVSIAPLVSATAAEVPSLASSRALAERADKFLSSLNDRNGKRHRHERIAQASGFEGLLGFFK